MEGRRWFDVDGMGTDGCRINMDVTVMNHRHGSWDS